MIQHNHMHQDKILNHLNLLLTVLSVRKPKQTMLHPSLQGCDIDVGLWTRYFTGSEISTIISGSKVSVICEVDSSKE